MAPALRRHGGLRSEAAQRAGGRELQAEADVCQSGPGSGSRQIHYRKKALAPCRKREIVKESASERSFGTSRVCRIIQISRSSLAYRSRKDDVHIEELLQEHAAAHPREGFWKAYFRIRNAGTVINHKRLHRVYKQLGLSLRRKVKKRLPARRKATLAQPSEMHDTWSIDFVSDALSGGRKFRSFNII